MTFTSEVTQMWHMYNYVLKSLFKYILYLSRLILRNFVCILIQNILVFSLLPLFDSEVKQMRYFYMFLGPSYLKIYSIKHIEMCLEFIS